MNPTTSRHRSRILKQFKMGTTQTLILVVLSEKDHYGSEIIGRVADGSRGFFQLKQGFLYPTLRRLERAELVKGYWKNSVNGAPRRKYYRLTPRGRAHLAGSVELWLEFHKNFNRMLKAAKTNDNVRGTDK